MNADYTSFNLSIPAVLNIKQTTMGPRFQDIARFFGLASDKSAEERRH